MWIRIVCCCLWCLESRPARCKLNKHPSHHRNIESNILKVSHQPLQWIVSKSTSTLIFTLSSSSCKSGRQGRLAAIGKAERRIGRRRTPKRNDNSPADTWTKTIKCVTLHIVLKTHKLKSSLPHLMKTETIATKRATKAQAVTHWGTPAIWCQPAQVILLLTRTWK